MQSAHSFDLPVPGPPHIKVVRSLGIPPYVILSKPLMTVGIFRACGRLVLQEPSACDTPH
jgi:hypothetical protein